MKKGFTLIELLAVIIILAIILVIAVPQILKTISSSTKGAFESDIKIVYNTLKLKMMEEGFDATSINETNIKTILGINDSNYESVSVTKNGESTFINIIGKDKWKNLIAFSNDDSTTVSDSLSLFLDAGNIKSYPGSGVTWYDLSSKKNNFTLLNNPVHSISNGGNFTFNGSTQYASITNPVDLFLDSNFTIIVFFKPATALTGAVDIRQTLYSGSVASSFGLEIGNFSSSCAITDLSTIGYRFLMHRQGSCFTNVSLTNQFAQNQLLNFTYSRSAGRSGTLFVNGNVITSVNNELSFIFADANIVNIARRASSSSQYFNGSIYNIQIYKEELSPEEIKHIYNSYKERYGI